MAVKVKYFYNPSYNENEWSTLNPLLKKGQLAVTIATDGLSIVGFKIGDGVNKWKTLKHLNEEIYLSADLVTNQIGDVKIGDSLRGEKVVDIIKRMVSPFVEPRVFNASNDADGIVSNVSVIEIGGSVDTSVNLYYSITNEENLDNNKIFIVDSGIFDNAGSRTHTGAAINLILSNTLIPTSPTTYTFGVYGIFPGGVTQTATTTINFYATVIWGYNDNEDLLPDGGSYNNPFEDANKRVAASYKATYSFGGTGYAYMCIPKDMTPTNVAFQEVTDASQPAKYSMLEMGEVTINNGSAAYPYIVYRSEYEIIVSTKMKLS